MVIHPAKYTDTALTRPPHTTPILRAIIPAIVPPQINATARYIITPAKKTAPPPTISTTISVGLVSPNATISGRFKPIQGANNIMPAPVKIKLIVNMTKSKTEKSL
jgi:hypothetical protein